MSSWCEECGENRKTIDLLQLRLDAAEGVIRAAETFKRELTAECIKAGNRTLDSLHGEAKIWNDANYSWAYTFARLFKDTEDSLAHWNMVDDPTTVARTASQIEK